MDREQLLAGLKRADAAGDVKAAAAFARALAGAQQGSPDRSQPQSGAGVALPPSQQAGALGTRLGVGERVPTDELGTMANFFKAALAGGVTQPVQRLRQLVGNDVPDAEIQATEEEIKKNRIGAGLGNIATMAIPSTAAFKGAQWLTQMLPRALQSSAKFSTIPTISAIQAGLTEPVKSNENAATKMLTAAVLGKATELGGRALFSPLTGMTSPTKEAQALIDMGNARGVRNIGQGAIPSVYAGTDDIMGGIIGAGQAMTQLVPRIQKSANARIQQEIGDLAGMRIHPDIPPTKEFVGRGPYIHNAFLDIGDEYQNVFKGKTFPFPQTFGQDVADTAAQRITGVEPRVNELFIRDVKNIFPQRPLKKQGAYTDKELQDKITQLRELVSEHEGANSVVDTRKAKAWKEVLDAAIAERNKMLTPEEIARVAHLDKTTHHAGIFEKALGMPDSDIGTNLIRTVEKDSVTPLRMRDALEGHFQDITEPAKEILSNQAKLDPLGKKLTYTALAGLGIGGTAAISPLVAGLSVPLLGLGYAANTRNGAKMLMGQFEAQKKAAEIMRKWGSPLLGASGANEWE